MKRLFYQTLIVCLFVTAPGLFAYASVQDVKADEEVAVRGRAGRGGVDRGVDRGARRGPRDDRVDRGSDRNDRFDRDRGSDRNDRFDRRARR